MDFQKLANSFHAPTVIISVQKKPDGGYGEIRLVAGNPQYIEPIEHPVFPYTPDIPGVPEILQATNRFIPNSLYEKYLPKDIGFESIAPLEEFLRLFPAEQVHELDGNSFEVTPELSGVVVPRYQA